MKKHNWLSSYEGSIIEIKIIEGMQVIEKYKFDANNQRDYARVIKKIFERYGFKPDINILKQKAKTKKARDYHIVGDFANNWLVDDD